MTRYAGLCVFVCVVCVCFFFFFLKTRIKYRTGEEIAKVVVREWRRLQSIAVVDFVDVEKEIAVDPVVESPSKNLSVTD